MLVAPVPVILLIVVFELGKFAGFAMVLFCIDTIRLIFLTVPCMVVIVFFVVIAATGLLILGSQHARRHCYWPSTASASIRAASSTTAAQPSSLARTTPTSPSLCSSPPTATASCGTPPASPPWTTASRSTSSSTDRKSTRLNSSHLGISYAVFCL